MANLELLLPRYRRAKSKWQEAASRLQVIAEFLLPYQSNITIFGSEGRSKTNRLYHSKGIRAADKLARTMHGTVTPSSFEWHSPVMRETELNKVKPIRAWLQECSRRMYAARAQSNFDMEVGRFWASFCALATAGMYVEEKPTTRPGVFGGLQYSFMPLGTFSIEQAGNGMIDTCYRELRWPLRSLVDKFGHGPVATAFTNLDTMLSQTPDKEIDFIHAVYPRVERDGRKDNTKNWAWASCYFLERGTGGTSGTGAVELSESGFREKPFSVARWDVAQREIWGIGPGHLAYPDVRSLNRVRQLKLEAGGTAVQPPTIADQKILLTEVSLAPGAVMYRKNGYPGETALEAFDNKAKFDVAELLEDDMVRDIEEMYYILELMLPDKGTMTLGEAQIRVEERQRLLGPTMGRLAGEFLMPNFEREFAIMLRAGAFPPPPPELLEAVEAGQGDIDVQWEGPLARAQRSYELLAMDRQNQGTFTLAAIPGMEGVLDLYDWDEQERRRAEITGYPADIMRDPAQVAQIRAQRQQALAAQQQAADAMMMAEGAGKAAPMVKALTPQAGTREVSA